VAYHKTDRWGRREKGKELLSLGKKSGFILREGGGGGKQKGGLVRERKLFSGGEKSFFLGEKEEITLRGE